MISNKYFDIYWENPLTTYKKIKNYFRPLKMKCSFTRMRAREATILAINSFDVIWKDKYNSPRHEFNPRIEISLFNYFHWRIDFTLGDDSMDDMVYWETALYWLYYDKTLGEAIEEAGGWETVNPETGLREEMKFKILLDHWQEKYDLYKDKLQFKYESSI